MVFGGRPADRQEKNRGILIYRVNGIDMENDTQIDLDQMFHSLKAYRKPELEELGDLRDITLGSSGPWCGVQSGHPQCPVSGHASSSKKFPSLFDAQETLQPKKKY
jgi:hypothetical protein